MCIYGKWDMLKIVKIHHNSKRTPMFHSKDQMQGALKTSSTFPTALTCKVNVSANWSDLSHYPEYSVSQASPVSSSVSRSLFPEGGVCMGTWAHSYSNRGSSNSSSRQGRWWGWHQVLFMTKCLRKICVQPGMTTGALYFQNLPEINLSVLLAICVLSGIRLCNKSFAQWIPEN